MSAFWPLVRARAYWDNRRKREITELRATIRFMNWAGEKAIANIIALEAERVKLYAEIARLKRPANSEGERQP